MTVLERLREADESNIPVVTKKELRLDITSGKNPHLRDYTSHMPIYEKDLADRYKNSVSHNNLKFEKIDGHFYLTIPAGTECRLTSHVFSRTVTFGTVREKGDYTLVIGYYGPIETFLAFENKEMYDEYFK